MKKSKIEILNGKKLNDDKINDQTLMIVDHYALIRFYSDNKR